VTARKADGRDDLAKQLAAAKMATAAVQALDEPEPRGSFYDLIYDSIRGALLDNPDSSTTATCGASPAAAPKDVEVTVKQPTS